MRTAAVEDLLSQAKELEVGGDMPGAIKRYDEVLELDPKNVPALEGTSLSLVMMGEPRKAIEYQDRLIELDPTDRFRLNQKADVLVYAGEYEQAIECLIQSLELEPSDDRTLQRIGDAYRWTGDTHRALDAYERALELAPTRADLWAAKGDLLSDTQQPDLAIDAFERASRLDPARFSEVDWNVRGDYYFFSKDYENAERFYRKGLETRPNAAGWRGLGLAYQDSGQLAEAVGAYEEGLKLEPDNVQLLNDKGVVLIDLGKLDDALECFEGVVKLDRESLEGWLNIGFVNRETRRFDVARDAYLEATKISPDRSDTWVDLGICQLEIGDDRESALRAALMSFEQGTALDESSLWAWNNSGWTLGQLGGDDSEALRRLNRAIELDQTQFTPWDNRIRLLMERARIDDAEACVDEMMKVEAHRAAALNLKANILTDWRGADEEALALLREAFELSPTDYSITANLAETLLKTREYQESRKFARKPLANDDSPIETRCACLFVIYASYVLEGKSTNRRRAAFAEFAGFYRASYVDATADPFTWNYQGLERAMREHGTPEESIFLLSIGIDIQSGRLDARKTSFFARTGAAQTPATP